MKHSELRKKCATYLEDLISAVKSEHSNAVLLDYLDFCARFHRYSFRNRLLIWMAKPNATHVAGFGTWKKLGRFVKKREKGIPIFAPMRVKKKPEPELEEDLSEEDDVPFFKVVYVWDVSQTDGKALPEAPDTLGVVGSAGHILPALESLVRCKGIVLEYGDTPYGAHGVSRIGKITVLPSANDEERFSILAHELAHELLHGVQERMNIPKKIKELEAEATAYTVCRQFDLETKSPSYLALYRVEEIDIRASLDRIVSTGSKIIQGIEVRTQQRQKKVA
jgi:antirestriction protein ArdC